MAEVKYGTNSINYKIGDSMELIKNIDNNSIDSIIADPPYEWGFMGKDWDKTGIAFNIDLWKECLRVLKPGAHALIIEWFVQLRMQVLRLIPIMKL